MIWLNDLKRPKKKKFSLLSKEEKANLVINRKQWKEKYSLDTIEMDVYNVLCKILDDFHVLPNDSTIRHLATLSKNLKDDPEKMLTFFYEYNKLKPGEKKKRSKKNMLLFYGKENLSEEYYNKWKEKIGMSLENFCDRYGSKEGEEKYKKYCEKLSLKQKRVQSLLTEEERKSRSPWCKEYWLIRGCDEKDAIIKAKEKSLECQKRGVENREDFTSACSRKFWLDRGYNEEESEEKYKEYKEKFSTMKGRLQHYIDRYGEERGIQKYKEMNDKRRASMISYFQNKGYMNNPQYSKESFEIFKIIENYIIETYGLKKEEMYYGDREYFLANGKKYYFLYDFTIPFKKIIIEYNGHRWHPNPYMFNIKEWDGYIVPFLNISAQDKFDIDNRKIEIAENRGFDVLIVWDLCGKQKNIEIIKRFVDDKI